MENRAGLLELIQELLFTVLGDLIFQLKDESVILPKSTDLLKGPLIYARRSTAFESQEFGANSMPSTGKASVSTQVELVSYPLVTAATLAKKISLTRPALIKAQFKRPIEDDLLTNEPISTLSIQYGVPTSMPKFIRSFLTKYKLLHNTSRPGEYILFTRGYMTAIQVKKSILILNALHLYARICPKESLYKSPDLLKRIVDQLCDKHATATHKVLRGLYAAMDAVKKSESGNGEGVNMSSTLPSPNAFEGSTLVSRMNENTPNITDSVPVEGIGTEDACERKSFQQIINASCSAALKSCPDDDQCELLAMLVNRLASEYDLTRVSADGMCGDFVPTRRYNLIGLVPKRKSRNVLWEINDRGRKFDWADVCDDEWRQHLSDRAKDAQMFYWSLRATAVSRWTIESLSLDTDGFDENYGLPLCLASDIYSIKYHLGYKLFDGETLLSKYNYAYDKCEQRLKITRNASRVRFKVVNYKGQQQEETEDQESITQDDPSQAKKKRKKDEEPVAPNSSAIHIIEDDGESRLVASSHKKTHRHNKKSSPNKARRNPDVERRGKEKTKKDFSHSEKIATPVHNADDLLTDVQISESEYTCEELLAVNRPTEQSDPTVGAPDVPLIVDSTAHSSSSAINIQFGDHETRDEDERKSQMRTQAEAKWSPTPAPSSSARFHLEETCSLPRVALRSKVECRGQPAPVEQIKVATGGPAAIKQHVGLGPRQSSSIGKSRQHTVGVNVRRSATVAGGQRNYKHDYRMSQTNRTAPLTGPRTTETSAAEYNRNSRTSRDDLSTSVCVKTTAHRENKFGLRSLSNIESLSAHASRASLLPSTILHGFSRDHGDSSVLKASAGQHQARADNTAKPMENISNKIVSRPDTARNEIFGGYVQSQDAPKIPRKRYKSQNERSQLDSEDQPAPCGVASDSEDNVVSRTPEFSAQLDEVVTNQCQNSFATTGRHESCLENSALPHRDTVAEDFATAALETVEVQFEYKEGHWEIGESFMRAPMSCVGKTLYSIFAFGVRGLDEEFLAQYSPSVFWNLHWLRSKNQASFKDNLVRCLRAFENDHMEYASSKFQQRGRELAEDFINNIGRTRRTRRIIKMIDEKDLPGNTAVKAKSTDGEDDQNKVTQALEAQTEERKKLQEIEQCYTQAIKKQTFERLLTYYSKNRASRYFVPTKLRHRNCNILDCPLRKPKSAEDIGALSLSATSSTLDDSQLKSVDQATYTFSLGQISIDPDEVVDLFTSDQWNAHRALADLIEDDTTHGNSDSGVDLLAASINRAVAMDPDRREDLMTAPRLITPHVRTRFPKVRRLIQHFYASQDDRSIEHEDVLVKLARLEKANEERLEEYDQTTKSANSRLSLGSRRRKPGGQDSLFDEDGFPTRHVLGLSNATRESMMQRACIKNFYAPVILGVNEKGRGIYAAATIYKGDFVSEYKGETYITSALIKLREKMWEKTNRGSYMFCYTHPYNQQLVGVDATEERIEHGWARLVNHSHIHPNLEIGLVCLRAESGKRKDDRFALAFRAARDIRIGEELLIDYGERRKAVLDKNPWLLHT